MLSTVEAEISSQPAALEKAARERLAPAPPGSMFVGAGDGYAASLLASSLSSGRHLAAGPYDLVADPALSKGRSVYFMSVSGRTASNLAAARAVEGFAKERTAITADASGALAEVTDSTILIPYRYVPRLSGTLSFSLSLLVLLRLAKGKIRCDFGAAFSRSKRDAPRLLISERGITHFLGNGAACQAGMYAALKVQEILGSPAQHWSLEQFSHAPLFSLRKADAVNAFRAFDPSAVADKLCGSLGRLGYSAAAVPTSGSSPEERVFHIAFLSQLAVVSRARSMGLSRPRFAGDGEMLAVSDSMIY